MNKNTKIKFYGATWCPDCRRSKQFLDDKKVAYEYINIEEVPGAAKEVEKINDGYQSIPTILFPNGKVLVEPSNVQLQQAIEEQQEHSIICTKCGMKAKKHFLTD